MPRGRPSKGDRDQFVTRPPRPVGNLVRHRAAQAGMTFSDYISAVLAKELGMPEQAPLPTGQSAEQLSVPLPASDGAEPGSSSRGARSSAA